MRGICHLLMLYASRFDYLVDLRWPLGQPRIAVDDCRGIVQSNACLPSLPYRSRVFSYQPLPSTPDAPPREKNNTG